MAATSARPRLVLLGGAVILSDGKPLGGPAAHRHRLALLALLAGTASPVSRDKLIAMLWPERDTESGRNLLKVAVHELRKVLGDNAIRTTGDQLSLDSSAVDCDLIELEAAHAAGNPERVAALYAGPFLDGFHLKEAAEFAHWADGMRSRIASLHAGAVEQLALAAERAGEWRAACGWWRRLATDDPLRADVALRLMRALEASGSRAEAIRHGEAHAEARRRELGLEPDDSVASLARELASIKPPPRPMGVPHGDVATVSRGDPEATHGAPLIEKRPLGRRAVIGAVTALAATVVMVGGIGWFVASRPDDPGTPADALAVLPFRVVGADTALAYLGAGMMEMLVSRIGSDGPMHALEASPSKATSESDQVPVAIQQGRSLGAEQVLVGDVVSNGGGLDVSAAIYRVSDAAVMGRATRTVSNTASVPGAMDSFAAELMARAASEPADRIGDLTRRPLAALRQYLAGQTAYRAGAYVRAESLFARALASDSTFALAGLGLALANSWTTINEHYGIGRDAALRGIESLGARDRVFVNAFFGSDPALGQPRPAPVYLEAWEDLVHKYPDFAEGWYHVGDRYYHFGGLSGLADPLEQARSAFARALAIDTGLVAPLHHLTEIYAARGDAAAARATGDRYFARNPGVSRDASAIGWSIAAVAGDGRWLSRIRANFGTMPLADLSRIAWITQANGWPGADADSALATFERRATATFEKEAALNVLHAFALNAGQPGRARRAAQAMEAQLPDQPIGALWSVYAVIFGEADSAGFGESVRRLAVFSEGAMSGNPDRRSRVLQARCLTGLAGLAGGNIAAARQDLALVRRNTAAEPEGSVQRREGSICSAWLAAAIAVDARGADARGLLARLDTMVLRDRVPPRMSLAAAAIMSARLHQRLGETSAALAASRWREHFTGDPVFLSTQLRLEGELALISGDTAAARKAWGRYLALRPAPEAGAATAATSAVRRQLGDLERR